MTASALERLTPQLAVFARHFADSGNAKTAALAAGVDESRAGHWSRGALNNHEVRAAVEHCVRARFADAGPLALSVLVKFARNDKDKYKPDLQLAAARDLLNRSGYTAKDMKAAVAEIKDLKEMSREELLATLDGTERELSNRARQVENAPQIGASSTQVIDLEG